MRQPPYLLVSPLPFGFRLNSSFFLIISRKRAFANRKNGYWQWSHFGKEWNKMEKGKYKKA